MSKHTPGPWSVMAPFAINSTDPARIALLESQESTVVDSEGNVVAYCTTYHDLHEDGADKENAKLIAAAPDLLEALEDLFADYKSLADSGDAGFWKLEDQDAGKRALAAIAKARGEAK